MLLLGRSSSAYLCVFSKMVKQAVVFVRGQFCKFALAAQNKCCGRPSRRNGCVCLDHGAGGARKNVGEHFGKMVAASEAVTYKLQ